MNLPPFRLDATVREHLPPAVMESLLQDIEDFAKEVALTTAEAVVVANYGPAIGPAVFADLSGTAAAPNGKLAAGKRAAVSKAACKLRRGLGLPIRCAYKVHPRRAEPAPERDLT